MKLQSFTGNKIFGFIELDIDFKDTLTFLTGVNGSGKTTALNLINSLLNPDFRHLIETPFERITLSFLHKNVDYQISCIKDQGDLTIELSSIDDKIYLLGFDKEVEAFSLRKGNSDYINNLNLNYRSHPIFEVLTSLPSTVYLGLDRRIESNDDSYYSERTKILSSHFGKRSKRKLSGSLGMSLMETELRVQDTYRRMRHFEDNQAIKLRDSILLSAFKYSSFTPDMMENNGWKDSAHLLNRKNEILEALSKIDALDKRVTQEIEHFFSRIDELFKSLEAKDGGISVEWLTNKAQIGRISDLVDIIDDHKSKLDKHFSPINKFLNKINLFIMDTGKKIIIDPVGNLVVLRPNGSKCTIEGLSSGERQILIIISHAIFNKASTAGSVFIIDEPELSLHMRWQEIFIDEVKSISPNTQFILATHSPDIVGEYKSQCVGVR